MEFTQKFNAEEVGIGEVVAKMKDPIELIGTLLKDEAKSKFTPLIENADNNLDNAWRGAELISEGYMLCQFPEEVSAATEIHSLLNKYGDPSYKPYAEEISIMRSIEEELLSQAFADKLKTIFLHRWAMKMKELRVEIQDLIEKRKLDMAQKYDTNVREVRKILTPLHSLMIKVLEVAYAMNKQTPATNLFVDALNEHIKQYKKLLQ